MFKIGLPNPSELSAADYFAQMKIVIKSAQLAYEQATKNLTEEEKENFYLVYRFPKINLYEREQDDEGYVKIHVDEESDQMQDVELEIGSA